MWGLEDSHHISEVLTHPTDPDVAYVASQGHLWGHSGETGDLQDGGWRPELAPPCRRAPG